MMDRSETKPASSTLRSLNRRKRRARLAAERRMGGAGEDYSLGREIWRTGLNLLGILFGLLLLGACLAGWYASRLAVTVLQEIGERDFAAAYEQIGNYESFMDELGKGDYIVNQGKTNITEGRERYTWVVQPRGSNEMRRFQWVHDYEANEVYPLTNPALCLDVELGYITAANAAEFDLSTDDIYDPDDMITQSIVKNNFSIIKTQFLSISEGWLNGNPGESAVGAPRISPAEAAGREAAANARAAEEQQEQPDPAEETPAAEAGEATEVVGGNTPPEDPASD